MTFLTKHGVGNPPLPVRLLALAGYSTVGKDTLIAELAKRYSFVELSAGEPFKQILINKGLPREAVTGNSPLRNNPDPRLGINQQAGRPYTPREAEIELQEQYGVVRLANTNPNMLRHAMRDGIHRVVFNGYRFPEQHRMLGGLRQQYPSLLRVRIRSPQLPVPPAHSRHDHLIDALTFDEDIVNDKTKPPAAMVEQLAWPFHQNRAD